MKKVMFLLFLFPIFYIACSDYSPKPYGYYHIGLPTPTYVNYNDSGNYFSFNRSEITAIEAVQDTVIGEWFNIIYPTLNAMIYCSYLPITSHVELAKISEDSRKFVYKHAIKADVISEERYQDVENHVYSLVYNVHGNVASPVQFVITDSVRYFFRGALYFNSVPNQDSIAPVTTYICNDIQEIISSFRWGKK